MRKTLAVTLSLVLIAIAYLALAPVPVDPVRWEPPVDAGLIDPFEVNDRLNAASGLDLGIHEGPEDACIGKDGFVYATTKGGDLLRIHPRGESVAVFARLAGRPLGIEAAADGSFLVANAYLGIQHVSVTGHATTLLSAVDGQPLVYANDVAVGPDGVVYFSESSTRFGAEQYGGTFEASLLDIVEHGGHGRIIAFDPRDGRTEVLISGLNFANGIAVSPDGAFLLVSETGHYRIWRYWLRGPDATTSSILIDNLPGFPDNLNNGLQTRYWVGLIAPRNALLDRYAHRPALRKVMQRLPARLRPKPVLSSHVIAIDADGVVLENLQDPRAAFPMLTGVVETADALYLTTLVGNVLPYIEKSALVR